MGDVTVSACPACGETVTPPGLFCEACGHDLSAPAVAVGQASPPATCPGCGSTKIDADRFCNECGRKAPSGRDHAQIDIGGMVGVSDRGLRHHRGRKVDGDAPEFWHEAAPGRMGFSLMAREVVHHV